MYNNYSINIACFYEKILMSRRSKILFTFKMFKADSNTENVVNSDFDAHVDNEMFNRIPENLLSLPKILLNKKKIQKFN